MGPVLGSSSQKNATVFLLHSGDLLLSWNSSLSPPLLQENNQLVTISSLSFLAAALHILFFSGCFYLWLCLVALVGTLLWWCHSLLFSSLWHGFQYCSIGHLKEIGLCEVLSSCHARKWHLGMQLIGEKSSLHVEVTPGHSWIGRDVC